MSKSDAAIYKPKVVELIEKQKVKMGEAEKFKFKKNEEVKTSNKNVKTKLRTQWMQIKTNPN